MTDAPAAPAPREDGLAVQVEPTRDQEIQALMIDFRKKAEGLGAKGVIACFIMEGEEGKPESQYLAHTMHGPLTGLHRACIILATQLGQAITKQQGQQPAVLVPEGEARRRAADAGQAPRLILPGAANGR